MIPGSLAETPTIGIRMRGEGNVHLMISVSDTLASPSSSELHPRAGLFSLRSGTPPTPHRR